MCANLLLCLRVEQQEIEGDLRVALFVFARR
jgi:hypothetical protein